MGLNSYYCIDLDVKKPRVLIFDGEELEFDLAFYKVSNALELQTFDRKIFKTIDKAESYLKLFSDAYDGLDNSVMCKDRTLPCMLLKRRYIVQTLLKEKTYTIRNYRKNWKKGDLFNFHDQTFFLTCKLDTITKIGKNYRYDFKTV